MGSVWGQLTGDQCFVETHPCVFCFLNVGDGQPSSLSPEKKR